MPINIDPGDIIAGLALFLSAYATWRTTSFNEKQKTLFESQEKLNKLLLEKGESDSMSDKKADLMATFTKFGNNKYRLKIWNKGNATARNVQLEFPEGNTIVFADLHEKFPLESLEKFQSVELIPSVHAGTQSKHVIRLIWADDAQDYNEKLTYPTL